MVCVTSRVRKKSDRDKLPWFCLHAYHYQLIKVHFSRKCTDLLFLTDIYSTLAVWGKLIGFTGRQQIAASLPHHEEHCSCDVCFPIHEIMNGWDPQSARGCVRGVEWLTLRKLFQMAVDGGVLEPGAVSPGFPSCVVMTTGQRRALRCLLSIRHVRNPWNPPAMLHVRFISIRGLQDFDFFSSRFFLSRIFHNTETGKWKMAFCAEANEALV